MGKKHEPVVCDGEGPRDGSGPGQVNGWGTILGDVQKPEGGDYSDETSSEGHGACSDSCCLNDDILLGSY